MRACVCVCVREWESKRETVSAESSQWFEGECVVNVCVHTQSEGCLGRHCAVEVCVRVHVPVCVFQHASGWYSIFGMSVKRVTTHAHTVTVYVMFTAEANIVSSPPVNLEHYLQVSPQYFQHWKYWGSFSKLWFEIILLWGCFVASSTGILVLAWHHEKANCVEILRANIWTMNIGLSQTCFSNWLRRPVANCKKNYLKRLSSIGAQKETFD